MSCSLRATSVHTYPFALLLECRSHEANPLVAGITSSPLKLSWHLQWHAHQAFFEPEVLHTPRSFAQHNQFDPHTVAIGLNTQTTMLRNVVQKPPLQLLTPSECTISNTDAMPN